MKERKFVGVLQAHPDDCVSAGVASLFGVSLESVPRFSAESWGDELDDWLASRGFGFINVRFPDDQKRGIPSGYTIGAVATTSGRHPGSFMHCVICLDGMIVWDPLMGEQPGTERAEEYTIIYRLRPTLDIAGVGV